jgi:hypothetical protein
VRVFLAGREAAVDGLDALPELRRRFWTMLDAYSEFAPSSLVPRAAADAAIELFVAHDGCCPDNIRGDPG